MLSENIKMKIEKDLQARLADKNALYIDFVELVEFDKKSAMKIGSQPHSAIRLLKLLLNEDRTREVPRYSVKSTSGAVAQLKRYDPNIFEAFPSKCKRRSVESQMPV